MNEQRRRFLGTLTATAITVGLPLTNEALGAEAKPLTTASLAKSLLTLADKAELQGMTREAQAIYQAVKVVMGGSPAKLAKQEVR